MAPETDEEICAAGCRQELLNGMRALRATQQACTACTASAALYLAAEAALAMGEVDEGFTRMARRIFNDVKAQGRPRTRLPGAG